MKRPNIKFYKKFIGISRINEIQGIEYIYIYTINAIQSTKFTDDAGSTWTDRHSVELVLKSKEFEKPKIDRKGRERVLKKKGGEQKETQSNMPARNEKGDDRAMNNSNQLFTKGALKYT